ncbi:MAG: type II toxin-antitoxin system HicB family antitoxin [Solirubrobacteraceae bacterium]
MDLTVVVHEECGSFWAEAIELPGCFASGGTLTELDEAMAEAAGLYLWDLPAELHPPLAGVGEHDVALTPVARGRRPRS